MKLKSNFESYRSLKALNASLLKSFVESERLGLYEYENPKETTQAMTNGRAFHTLVDDAIAGTENFHKQFICFDMLEKSVWGEDPNRRKGDYQTWEKEVLEDQTVEFYDEKVLSMFGSLENTKLFKELIKGSESEVILSNYYNCTDLDGENYQIPVKSMLDVVNLEKKVIIDWKTIADLPTKQNIIKAIRNYNYKLQAAFYYLNAFLEFGEEFDFIFCFVQSAEPYEIGLFQFNSYQLKEYVENDLKTIIIEAYKIVNYGQRAKYIFERTANEFNPLGAFCENI
jgi:hypothetical protein